MAYNYIPAAGLQIDNHLYRFITEQVLPSRPDIQAEAFWQGFAELLAEFAPRNRALLEKRDAIQQQIDDWHKKNGAATDAATYRAFLKEIGYLADEPAPFKIGTQNVDREVAEQAGPQLVVPINNARYALNAANARWGSLYDALYGTDAIDQSGDLAAGKTYNPKRGDAVIAFARNFLDQSIPLAQGSHRDVSAYRVEGGRLKAKLKDGGESGLQTPELFIGYNGHAEAPSSLLFLHNGLHIDILIDKNSPIGSQDPAGVKDIILEAALSTIMDCEDSVAAVDGEDKALVYANWLGLMNGTLTEEVEKGGKYVVQLIDMYTKTIGSWARPLVGFIAFACMFGTTITVIDGYSRAVAESARLVRGREFFRTRELFAWILWTSASGIALILWFNSALGALLKFAMISAFLTAPVFAWLNYGLVKQDKKHKLSPMMNLLAIVGLVYLVGFALLFVLNLLGVLA